MRMPGMTVPRADTGVTNTQMGIRLFLASEVMLFGGLFSAYAFVRAAASQWPHGPTTLPTALGVVNTVLLTIGTVFVWRARSRPVWLWSSSLASIAFVAMKSLEWRGAVAEGLLPSTDTFFAMYYTLTGVHVAHVVGGVMANTWAATGLRRVGPDITADRTHALALYWTFVDMVWLAIFVLMYLL
jgi:heme/copper-type cytochrome/quinol oxidase subunit 3